MDLNQLLYRRLSQDNLLNGTLAKYADKPAIFNTEFPPDQQEGWNGKSQYPRISYIVTDALTAFGLKAKDAGHFSDVLAKASASSNTNVGMLGESFKYVAPIAGAMKYSVEDTSLALGLTM